MKSPSAQGATVQEAARLLQTGKPADAEAMVRGVLGKSPNDAAALHLLGVLCGQRGEHGEAIAALERAVKIAPTKTDLWMNLGVLLMDMEPARAEECFRRVLALDAKALPARGNLATLHYRAGQYDDAEKEVAKILAVAPNDADAVRLLGRTQRMKKNFAEEVKTIRRLVLLEPHDAQLLKTLSETYFLWYDSVDRDREAAIAVLDEWLEFEPDAPVARHMHASLTGVNAPDKASAEYVEYHFDAFAPQFDAVLAGLDYRGPEVIRDGLAVVAPEARGNLDIADIGCGTGRLGELVTSWKRRLVGVDLSRKMLEQARARGVYDELVHADVTAFLGDHAAAFDVVACADTLIYFGDLASLFGAAHRALRKGGSFLATIETLDENAAHPFRLHGGGRYAHKRSYVEAELGRVGFAMESASKLDLRVEFGERVEGLVFTARCGDRRTV